MSRNRTECRKGQEQNRVKIVEKEHNRVQRKGQEQNRVKRIEQKHTTE